MQLLPVVCANGIREILEDEKTFLHDPAKAERIPHIIAKKKPTGETAFHGAACSNLREGRFNIGISV
jgi:hypothetical protein